MRNQYPDKYWHCYVVEMQEKKKNYFRLNDLTFDELKKTIITPWKQGIPFVISGKIIRNRDDATEIKIVQTEYQNQVYVDMYNQRMRNAGIADLSNNRNLSTFHNGKDFTFELLFEDSENITNPIISANDSELVIKLCERICKSANILCNRMRKDKISYKIEDEYDVQDLLQALLRGYLKYSVQENPIGKVAGTKSARADISIEELGIIIETKYARNVSDQKEFLKQYSEDLLLYSKYPNLKLFIYLIYNSAKLSDSEAFEELSGDTTIRGASFKTKIIMA